VVVVGCDDPREVVEMRLNRKRQRIGGERLCSWAD
jgi:hypothetical protein